MNTHSATQSRSTAHAQGVISSPYFINMICRIGIIISATPDSIIIIIIIIIVIVIIIIIIIVNIDILIININNIILILILILIININFDINIDIDVNINNNKFLSPFFNPGHRLWFPPASLPLYRCRRG